MCSRTATLLGTTNTTCPACIEVQRPSFRSAFIGCPDPCRRIAAWAALARPGVGSLVPGSWSLLVRAQKGQQRLGCPIEVAKQELARPNAVPIAAGLEDRSMFRVGILGPAQRLGVQDDVRCDRRVQDFRDREPPGPSGRSIERAMKRPVVTWEVKSRCPPTSAHPGSDEGLRSVGVPPSNGPDRVGIQTRGVRSSAGGSMSWRGSAFCGVGGRNCGPPRQSGGPGVPASGRRGSRASFTIVRVRGLPIHGTSAAAITVAEIPGGVLERSPEGCAGCRLS